MNARPTPCRLAALLLLLLAGACGEKGKAGTAPRPSGATLAFVAPETCKACHHEEWKKWTGSDHQLAMQPATEETVLADFDEATFEKDGVTTRFFKRKDDAFFVETDGEDGVMTTYPVPYTFGVYPLQQYLLDVGEGRLQALSICWDVEKKVWFHLYDEPIPHDDPLHWTGRFQNWNYMCGECHVTGYDKGYDVASNTFQTTWLALGVGCQECHGPGSAHVAWAKRIGDRVADVAADDAKGLAVDLGAADASVQIDACARCHARRDIVHAPFEHGTPFLDHYEPELLVHPLYFPDGQILDEVYVYGSFLQAKKRARGVRCSDCHDPHRAKLKFEGNATCTQCHQPESPERFPTLVERRKVYDAPSHTHHEMGTPGAACVNCHMPATTYMQVDPRRDHAFRIPRPDLTEKIGTPNPCTGCHEKEGAAWAADRIASWFPESTKARRAATTFGEIFHEARQDEARSVPALAGLARDAARSDIVRATALREMRRFGTPAVLDAALAAAKDAEPLVRLAALDLLQALIPRQAPPAWQRRKLDAVRPALTDPLRALRVEAARVLADVSPTLLTASDRLAQAAALEEFRRRQAVLADRPESWLNLGALEEALGRERQAEQAYRKALEISPDFIPVRFNLANLLNRRGENAEAELLLRQVIQLMPEHGEGHYSLGLLLAEEQKYGPAAAALSNAADLMPGRPRLQYNRALVLERLGRLPEAAAGLERAHALAPEDAEIVHALALLHLRKRDGEQARIWAKKLLELRPDDPAVKQLLEITK